MSVSKHDEEMIDEIMQGYGDWFTAQLLRLLQKADSQNIAKMRQCYPDVVDLYEKWMREGGVVV